MAKHIITSSEFSQIELPEGMTWRNEFTHTTIEQKVHRSISGSLIVQNFTKFKGRSIELSGDENSGWVTRQQLDTIYAVVEANHTMALVINDNDREESRIFNVIFDQSQTPITASPIIDYQDMSYNDFYNISLKFITI